MNFSIARRIPSVLAFVPMACVLFVNAPVDANAQTIGATTSRAQRAMDILRVKQIGLEVWVESEPEPWEHEVQPASNSRDTPRLLINSPPKVYPATALSLQTLAVRDVPAGDFRQFAQGLVDSFSRHAGAKPAVVLEPATWGQMQGWQGRFSASQSGRTFETQIFVGQAPGHPPVLLQAQTDPGKLDHASEFIRRCWSNLKYL